RHWSFATMNTASTVLQLGDSGGEVELLQERLIERGYDLGASGADGQFGPATQAAVEQFQEANGLDADGIVGKNTQTALLQAKYVARDKQQDVVKLQKRLIELNYDLGSYGADGIFGSKTKEALMQFQSDYGLDPDGILGPETEKALQSAYISNVGDKIDERQEPANNGCDGANYFDETKHSPPSAGFVNPKDTRGIVITQDQMDAFNFAIMSLPPNPVSGGIELAESAVVKTDEAAEEFANYITTMARNRKMAQEAAEAEAAQTTVEESNTASGACFVAGTIVLTEQGNKSIEEIKVGDKVLSENADTGEKGYKEVRNAFVKEVDTLVHLDVEGTKIDTTENHRFWVVNEGWIEAGNLEEGDKVLLSSGKIAEVSKVSKEKLDKAIKVYNFEVSDWHTYFVSDAGVFVHNVCKANPSTQGAGKAPDYIKDNRVPLDKETVLSSKDYTKTNIKVKGAQVYKNGDNYYYRDTFHTGEASHLEVFDKRGNHIGEANPQTGELIPGTADPTKKINVR
ncbi:peptidoglycan-binding protein, partial [Clostridium sp. Maddingley MBC34-26]